MISESAYILKINISNINKVNEIGWKIMYQTL